MFLTHFYRRALPLHLLRLAAWLIAVMGLPTSSVHAQKLFFYHEFDGGVTVGGYAPDDAGFGTGTIDLHFPPKATLRSATLFAGEHYVTTPFVVYLNGQGFQFDSTNRVTTGMQSVYGSPASTHAIDVSAAIDPAVAGQSLNVPSQPSTDNRYTDFLLVVEYTYPGASRIRVSMFLDTLSFADHAEYALPIGLHNHSSNALALGLYLGYVCDTTRDAEIVRINGAGPDTVGWHEDNSGICAGPMPHFYYEHATLAGLGACNADPLMHAADVVADIRTFVSPLDDTLRLVLDHAFRISMDNSTWGMIVVDGDTGCVPRTLSLAPSWQGAIAGDTITYSILSNGPVPSMRTLDLDLALDPDILGYVGSSGPNAVTWNAGHVTLTGAPTVAMSGDTIARLRFAVFVSKNASCKLHLSHLELDSLDAASVPCPLSLDTDAAFTLLDRCGDSTIRTFLSGNFGVQLLSIVPNPAATSTLLRIRSRSKQNVTIAVVNDLGLVLIERQFAIVPGENELPVDLHDLPNGAYSLEVRTPERTIHTTLIKAE